MSAGHLLEQRIQTHADTVGECIRRAMSMRSHGSRRDPEPDDLPVAAVLVATALDARTLHDVAVAIDTKEAYERVESRIRHAASELLQFVTDLQLVELTDQAWLLIRPAVVAARVASGQDIPVDEMDSVVPLPFALAGLPFNAPPGEWFAQLRTIRADDSWWIDRFVARGAGYVRGSSAWTLLCPVGHCLHDSQSGARRYLENEFHCPVCAKSRAVKGISSLLDTHPHIAAQWDHKKNGDLTGGELLGGSGVKIWWRCTEGHSWQATVANRVHRRSGCPYCSAKAVLPNHNDLATTHPSLAEFWDPGVEQKQPYQVSAGNSAAKLHLKCTVGHRFVRSPAKLVSRPFCPYCEGRTVAEGENDFMTTHSEAASWWHPFKNGVLEPSDVKAGSEKRVWWICPDGHEFEQKIDYRSKLKIQRCPVDTGHVLLSGVNDLATKHPELLTDWDYERNDVDPSQVVPGVRKRWWTCCQGHSQHSQVRNRVRSGGCSVCLPENRAGTPTSEFRRGRQGWDKRVAPHIQSVRAPMESWAMTDAEAGSSGEVASTNPGPEAGRGRR